MDNLTHTLVGMLVGATAVELTRAVRTGLSEAERRSTVIVAAAIGSNLPDLDVLYSATSPGKLGYLLEHRGYTHTVIGALLGALLLWAVCEVIWRHRHSTPNAADRVLLASVAVFTPLLHIAMDFTNSYGVHPFWPFDNHWYYGDAVFIIEPLIWVAMTPLLFAMQSRWTRGVLIMVLLAGALIGGPTGRVPWAIVVALLILMVALFALARRLTLRAALLASVGLWCSITAAFAYASHVARHELTAALTREETLLDIALTPTPANPLCWEAILMTTRADEYVLRRASFSLAPRLMTATACRNPGLLAPATAPLRNVAQVSNESMAWRGEFAMPRAQLITIVRDHCDAAAFLRFARAPFFATRADGTIAGDLRYDREAGLSFTEFALAGPEVKCAVHVPPWDPPRGDIIHP